MAIANLTAGRRLRASELNAIIAVVNKLSLPPQFKVRRAATQTLTSGVAAFISFDTEDVDTNTMFTATSDTITIKTAGRWLFWSGGTISGNSNLKVWEIVRNGVVLPNGATTGPDTALQAGRANAIADAVCAVNDVIKLQAFQNAVGNQTVTAVFSGMRISD